MAQWKAAILAFARNLFAREALPPPPPSRPTRRTGPGVAELLFAPEDLPEDPVPSARPAGARRKVLSLLFSPEPLPQEEREAPAPASPRRGAASLLFAPEELPEEPVGPPRRRGHWLEWLFKPEKLDR